MYGQGNANAEPEHLDAATCAEALRAACTPDSKWQQHTMLFGLSHDANHTLSQLAEDVAFFLLARGPYAYVGWSSWGMGWPFNPEPAHGTLPAIPSGIPVPVEWHADYGVPSDAVCRETEPGKSGIFTREWTKASVRLDCGAFQGSVVPKRE